MDIERLLLGHSLEAATESPSVDRVDDDNDDE
jgi:hypothetical protein